MKKYSTLLSVLFAFSCNAQISDTVSMITYFRNGLIYVHGIEWTEDKNGEIKAYIETKDTIGTVKSLLTYCLEEKEENMYASCILDMINLDALCRNFKNKSFSNYVKLYRESIKNHKKRRFNLYKKYYEN